MPDYRNDLVEFDAELMDERDKCYVVQIDGETYFPPKSISEWRATTSDGVVGVISVPTWWALKEELA